MTKLLLLGDEAIAQGALDAGISGAYGYPGTPSTEIITYIQEVGADQGRKVHDIWSTNEKTALEEGLGMSYAGKRALVTMKHVGLNVAADCFMNAAITGVNGGLLILVADDPSMHSSQNEQDSRFFAKFAMIPLLEPHTQQEAYDMMRYGFELSEAVKLPVMVRVTTRLCHSRADVVRGEVLPEKPLSLSADRAQFILLPGNARRNYAALIARQPALVERSESSRYNEYIDGADKRLGILATGIAVNYLREVCDGESPHPVLSLRQYPVPVGLIRRLFEECDEILVMEEGMPLLEEQLVGLLPPAKAIHGRLDGSLPRTGELSPDVVGTALGLGTEPAFTVPGVVAMRPPKLCTGCAHAGTYTFLKQALARYEDPRVLSDIGCYTLGALSPYEAIDSCVDMGASITMAKGASDAGVHPAIAVIGDSTFTHSGITGLLDCVLEGSNVTILILDNDTTAMTGGQDSAGMSGRIDQICLGLGVEPEHLHVIDPLPRLADENAEVLVRELDYRGVSVVICRRVCIQAMNKRKKEAKLQA